MINITDASQCCGCSACASACPMQCISMKADAEGFLTPEVDMERCVSCKVCERVCPMLNPRTDRWKGVLAAYIVRNQDKKVLYESSSGGFFTPLAQYVVDRGGYAVGAVFDEQWRVCHLVSGDSADIPRFRGSKYVQSDMRDVFGEVKTLLEKGAWVAFSGTPCQVVGLKSFLRKDYAHLLTMDFVCHGVPSPMLWNHYVKRYAERHIVSINHRSKRLGYHSSVMRIEFADGRPYMASPRTDFALKPFYSDIASRYSCYECRFKGVERVSDFTVWDCWKPMSADGSIAQDDLGYTALIVHTDRGMDTLHRLSGLTLHPVDPAQSLLPKGRSMMTDSCSPHKRRGEFYVSLQSIGLEATVRKFIPNSQVDKFAEWVKLPLRSLGLLRFLNGGR